MIDACTDTAEGDGPTARPSHLSDGAMRSAFGFDRADEEWVGMVRESTLPSAGGRLGSYELVEEIGRGAQGAVYKAIQPGTNRLVAVKRVTVGPGASGHALERFRREIEAASLLSHPGIVTVLGTEIVDGRPVLAMEYVEGQPIDRWAARTATAGTNDHVPRGHVRREVLETFVAVCDAVAHAHRRGVLHRDLKPSNILVDSAGRPHVLDFGLAKLTADTGTPASFATQGTGFFGTPAYAPPEQINGEMRKVDTRSDVYSLGVILYQLIAGSLPFDTERGLPELFDQIRRGSLRPPSAHRPGAGGELDAIVMKAIAPEPERRYGTAEELCADVRRLLSGEAVLAHPPSTVYELRKIVTRHRVAFGVGMVGAAMVAALAVVLAVLAARLSTRGQQLSGALAGAQAAKIRAEQEAARSTSNAEFLRDMLASLGRAATDRQLQPEQAMVRDAIARLEAGGLSDQPELEVQLWRQVARTALLMGMVTEGERCAERALARATSALGPDHPDTARVILTRGFFAETRGDLTGAERDYRHAAEVLERTVGATDPDTMLALADTGAALNGLGRSDEAERFVQRSLDLRLRAFGPEHRDVGQSLRLMGSVRAGQRRDDEALGYFRRALEVYTLAGSSEADLRGARTNIARILRNQGKLDEAAEMLTQIAEECRARCGENSLDEAISRWYLADVRVRQKRFDDAAGECAIVVSAYRAHYPADHPRLSSAVARWGSHLLAAGRPAEAEPVLREGLTLTETCKPATASAVKDCRKQLASCLRALNRPDEAAAIEALPEFVPPAPAPAPTPPRGE